MITFLISFTLLLLLSSFFILGWYEITRGYYVIQPDNSKKRMGEILGWWELFWEDYTPDRIYYSGDALLNKLQEINYLKPKIGEKIALCDAAFGEIEYKEPLSAKETVDLENICNCKTDDEGFLYIEEQSYVFPSWIRKPISSCPICMANPYGTLIYFSINALNKFELFNIFEYKILSIFVFWFIFIVILSRLNTFLHKKL